MNNASAPLPEPRTATEFPPRIVVIGGGISGLAAAHRVTELSPRSELVLLESTDRLGGVLFTERRDGYLIEHGPDMFTTGERWARALCERIGFGGELITTDERYRRAMLVRGKRLYPVPMGFTLLQPQQMWPILATRLLSVRGKLRLLAERFIPPRLEATDESLADFARRRFGQETYERLVQPLVGGIYTADPEQLSMQATLDRFVQLERRHGSLIRAALSREHQQSLRGAIERTSSGARYAMFVAPREGMSSLVDAVARRLPAGSVRLGCRVERLERAGQRWRIHYRDPSSGPMTLDADAVILAAPAHRAAELVGGMQHELAELLGSIPMASAAIVIAAYRRADLAHRLDSFGFVVPLVERRRILSASFASQKFAGRAPDGHILVRLFVGGACQPELLRHDDATIRDLAVEDFAELARARAQPLFTSVRRWENAMPQYHLGHLGRVARIEELASQLPHFALAGNAYRGVGIPFCVRSGEQAAETVLEKLSARDRG